MDYQKTALLIVDVQTDIVENQPYRIQELLHRINLLKAHFKKNCGEIIFVRHDDGAGSSLEKGTPGWQICQDIAPTKGEKIFDKNYNSAFRRTGLREYLGQRGIDTLVLTGLQTEYCIDATCKVAFEYGFNVIIPEGTVSTLDNKYLKAEEINDFYVFHMWNNRYAKVMTMEMLLNEA